MIRRVAEHGHREHGPIPLPGQDVPERIVRFGQDIGNLGRLARDRAATGRTLPEGDLSSLNGSNEILAGIPAGADVEGLGLFDVFLDEPGVRIAELGGLLGDFMQDVPQIEGGADGAAHLAQRVDLFQRLLQFAGPLLNLLEEAHILDGDDGLVGKGLEELDLLVGEGLGFLATNHDRPERDSLRARVARRASPGGRNRLAKALPSGNSASSASARSRTWTACRSTTARPVTEPRFDRDTLFVPDPEFLESVPFPQPAGGLPIQTEENSIFCATQARGVLRDSVQHGLEVCRASC